MPTFPRTTRVANSVTACAIPNRLPPMGQVRRDANGARSTVGASFIPSPVAIALSAALPLAGCAVKDRQLAKDMPPTTVARGESAPALSEAQDASPAPALASRAIGTPAPVVDPTLAPEFNNLFSDGEFYFAGWPTEQGLRLMAARGVRTVISLKSAEEVQDARGYDPRALAAALGIRLIVIPVRPNTFSTADVASFTKAIDQAGGPVLIHCGSSNTVGGMWAAYLAGSRGVDLQKAMELGRAAGLRDGPMATAAERVAGESAASK